MRSGEASAEPIYLQPWFHPEYFSFYVEGLRRAFPDRPVRMDVKRFPPLSASDWYRPRDTFAFIVDGQRITLSANDYREVHVPHLDWSHRHGRVNVDGGRAGDRVLPLGPAFGVRAFDRISAFRLAAAFSRYRPPPAWRTRQLLASLRRQNRREPLDRYRPTRSEASAGLYYLGNYWSRHREANGPRLRYLQAAHAEVRDVQGGLVYSSEIGPYPTAPATHRAYLEGIRRSAAVFNHDAVHGCLGWKLGEFLALGKAIITTPIMNALPAPLQHGRECHLVADNADAMREAIRLLLADVDYRRHLEAGARSYYERFVEPGAAIRRLVGTC